MIDPATGWFEIAQYNDKRSIANIVEQEWLAWYPWPTQVIFDRGSEFMGHDFQNMITNDYGIKKKPISARNPQANAIIERVHQVIGNIIRTFELQENYLDEDDPWKGILSATAVRSTYHTTLQKTPGQLVFGHDMIFNEKHIANWEYIRQCKQALIKKNNQNENAKHIPQTYTVGDQVMLRIGTENKQERPYSGPHSIIQVNTNGTV
jgi:transposase InsO family protein